MSTPGACRESQGVAVAKSSDNQTADFERLLSEGILLSGAGNHESALIRLQSALDLVPESGLAHGAAGFAAMALGDLDTAADHYALARHFLPDDENVVLGYASVLERQGKAALAESVLGDLISRNPAHPGAGFQLARLCYEAGKHDVAVLHLRRNLDLRPEHASSLNLLGLILAREYGDLGAGEKLIRRALELVPDFQAARSNLGWVLAENGRLDEAMDCFEVVLKANPQDAETRLMRAHAYLKSGNFTDGWRDFESRHASPLARPRSGWRDGKEIPPLDGKRVLICAEQGLGDQIMFASCVPDLLASGARGALECDKRLMVLFQRSFPDLDVFPQPFVEEHPAWEGYGPGIATQVAIGSLPGQFRRRLEDFPQQKAYLRADPSRVAGWRSKYEALGPGPYVGVSWRGGAQVTRQQLRTIPLTNWMGLLSMPGTFISLQYGDCQEELDAIPDGIVHHWPEALADYDETAAMVAALDQVVSVCTAVVHLSGALGVPVWVLTPTTPEWRYLAQGEQMPWYPSARLFRQIANEPWGAVLERVAKAFASP